MDIPQVVLDKAKNLIDDYGNRIYYIGINDNKEVFKFQFPEKERTGFPYIYQYDRLTNTVEEKTGIIAMKIIRNIL